MTRRIILTLLPACVLLLASSPAHTGPADEQAALAALRKAGAEIVQAATPSDGIEVKFGFPSKPRADDLVHLKELKNLKGLNFAATPVTDEGLAHVKGLQGLERLTLDFTRITDEGLKNLADLTSLRELRLGAFQVSDFGVMELKKLKNLEVLALYQTRVTDRCLTDVSEFARLRELYLGGTGITDEGLAEIKKLKNLRVLNLVDTRVTPAAVADLRKAMPGVEVQHQLAEEPKSEREAVRALVRTGAHLEFDDLDPEKRVTSVGMLFIRPPATDKDSGQSPVIDPAQVGCRRERRDHR